jgi:lipopolysaccharide transport system permease protein
MTTAQARARVHAVYTAESRMRSPWALVKALASDVIAARELAWRLFVRDLSAQYRQSLLGVFWAFVAPLVTSVIFIVLQSRNVVNFGQMDVPYPVYVITGTLLWQVFVESINAPLKAVTAAKPMLAKINFPREALILSALYLVLYGLAIKLIVMGALLLVFGVVPGWGALAALGPILALVLCGITAGLLLTPIGMLYADVGTALPVLTQLMFFVTPIVYVPPQTFPFSLIKYVNPVSPLLMAARDLITLDRFSHATGVAAVSAVTLLGLFVALVAYRLAVPIFIERTSA